MKPHLRHYLYTDFPQLFLLFISPRIEPLLIGDGWYQIIRNLSLALSGIIADQGLDAPGFHFTMLKEKFGGLRIGMSDKTAAMEEVMRKAVEEAEVTCETCGQEGELRTERWMDVRCRDCDRRWREKSGLAPR